MFKIVSIRSFTFILKRTICDFLNLKLTYRERMIN